MKEIYLCGTHHADLKGPERLSKIIRTIQPDYITIEGDKDYFGAMCSTHMNLEAMFKKPHMGEKFIEEIAKSIFSNEQLASINKDSLIAFYRAMGYDAWIPALYKIKNQNVGITGIDDGEDSNVANQKAESMIGEEITKYLKLNPKNFQEMVDKEYEEDECKVAELVKLNERNDYMANRLKQIERQKILHVGGYAHIFGNSPNMFDLLDGTEQKVCRVKLNKADELKI